MSAGELGRRAARIIGRDKPISPSAVRNQENGTNGIPASTAHAYGEVLGVEPSWLIWGEADVDGSYQAAEPPSPDDEFISSLQIPALGLISSRWLTPLFHAGLKPEDNYLYMSIKGWDAQEAELQAYEVLDHTLEPTFRRGARLVIAPVERSILHDGAHVLAEKYDGTELYQSIRQLRDAKGVVLLMAMGQAGGSDVVLFRDGEVAEDYWIRGVVIAVADVLPVRGHYVFVPLPKWLSEEEDETAQSPEGLKERREALRAARGRHAPPDEDFEGVPLEPHRPIEDDPD